MWTSGHVPIDPWREHPHREKETTRGLPASLTSISAGTRTCVNLAGESSVSSEALAGVIRPTQPVMARGAQLADSVLPGPLQSWLPTARWYFELTVSPGFDAEIPQGMPQKECQDEGVLVRNFAGDPELVFLGVFDGHGTNGLKASKFSGEHLPDVRARCSLTL
jgi:hypothetical protein